MSGKTTLAKKLLHKKRDTTGRKLLVLDPNLDPSWQADFMTKDAKEFLEVVKSEKSCELAIDESGEMIGRYAKDMGFLATRSRHYGHTATFIGQRAQQIDTNVRDQCSRFFVFSISKKDSQTLAEDLVDDEILSAYELPQGECLFKKKFSPIKRLNVFHM